VGFWDFAPIIVCRA